MEEIVKVDRLCLLPTDKLRSMRPYSNISEYCLRDGDAIEKYFLSRGEKCEIDAMSDFELLSRTVELLADDKATFVSHRIRDAFNELCLVDTFEMAAEEIWSLSAEILDKMGACEIFDLKADEIGLPYSENMPKRIGNTAVKAVACPFGAKKFDLETWIARCGAEETEKALLSSDSVAIFFGGFEFATPNEYAAQRAIERLSSGGRLSHKESPILGSQLCRELALRCASEGKELMAFMPSSPDVRSMGEFAAFLDYVDGALRNDSLNVTVFASDAVGFCFANSITSKVYKKITAETGICGNGCGCAGKEDAEYWGVDALGVKRASLSSSPAFIGK